jgi:hypothetical protein
MTILLRCRRAAILATVLAGVGLAFAAAAGTVETPANRQLVAAESMVSPAQSGSDYSVNPPSLSGLTLLAMIPASSGPRSGYIIQAQCAAGLTVALDDQAGTSTPTLVVLQGSTTDGGEGGSLSMAGMPHSGRIRIYSSAANCQMAARAW